MSTLSLIFDACTPRPDVERGTTKDEQFAADLAQVVNGTAPDEYLKPAIFFAHSYPTRGMKELLKAVCKRLSGLGGEVAAIIRLHTQYGGGKTHCLIAVTNAVRGMHGVPNCAEFIDPALLPKGEVRVAALDGENSDPANGLTLEGDLRAYTLWGELAYRLAGVKAIAGSRKAIGTCALREPRLSVSCLATSRRSSCLMKSRSICERRSRLIPAQAGSSQRSYRP